MPEKPSMWSNDRFSSIRTKRCSRPLKPTPLLMTPPRRRAAILTVTSGFGAFRNRPWEEHLLYGLEREKNRYAASGKKECKNLGVRSHSVEGGVASPNT